MSDEENTGAAAEPVAPQALAVPVAGAPVHHA